MDFLASFEIMFPLLIIMALGFSLKYTSVLSTSDAHALLRLVYYVGIPALIITSFARVEINFSVLLFAVLPFFVVAGTALIAFALRKTFLRTVHKTTLKTLVIGSMVLNIGFILPVVSQLFGNDGIARLIVIEVVMSLCSISIVYPLMARYSGKGIDTRTVAKNILFSTPFWALMLALTLKSFDMILAESTLTILEIPAKVTPPIILLALGVTLTTSHFCPRLLAIGAMLRLLVGAIIGISMVVLFGLDDLDAAVILLASIAPASYGSLAFSNNANLDTKFAASFTTSTILLLLVSLPFIISWL